MIRTVLTDDHKVFVEGLGKLLSETNDFEIIEKFNDGLTLLDRIGTLNLDLLIVDIDMPHLNGLEVIRRVRARNKIVKIVVLTMHEEAGYSIEASSLGANGLLIKSTETGSLINTIHSILGGINHFPRKHYPLAPVTLLSERETAILRKLSDGLSNETISKDLKISVLTVKTHRKNIQKKLQAQNSLQMIRIAFEKGLI
jgi:DNA-binding NarL/FixJ family response regulator